MSEEFIISLTATFTPFVEALQKVAQAIDEAVDSQRPGAFHPTGPVIHSTVTPVIEDASRLLDSPGTHSQ